MGRLMLNDFSLPPPVPLTPCIGICKLDDRGYCLGCLRTGDEIAGWRNLPDGERLRLMREVLPMRKATP